LLAEAELIERFREGSWAYFHVSDRTQGGRLALDVLALVDDADPGIARDRERAEALKREREASAQGYFRVHAADWDRIRALHVAESEVEDAMRGLGPGRSTPSI
jgi:ArsR family transcriptional regulator